jgi:hypothetical protein
MKLFSNNYSNDLITLDQEMDDMIAIDEMHVKLRNQSYVDALKLSAVLAFAVILPLFLMVAMSIHSHI